MFFMTLRQYYGGFSFLFVYQELMMNQIHEHHDPHIILTS